jgi:hypothetical protein
MSLNGNDNDNDVLLLNEEHEEELDEEGVKRMIESLCAKVEELMGLVRAATVVASKAVLEGQPAKECTKLTGKVKVLKKKKEEVAGLLQDLLESSRQEQYQK